MNKKEIATNKFFNGYNCAQSVVCTYAKEFNVDEETAFRMSEGFGSGIPGFENVCGACSGLIMVTSLRNCLKKNLEHPSRPQTYTQVKEMVSKFEERMGAIDCKTLKETKDGTLIHGKRKGCLECVLCACDIIEGR